MAPVLRAAAAVVASAAWAVERVEVEGDSMAPTLTEGDRLLCVRRWRRPRVGDLVVVEDPRRRGRRLVKRVARVSGTRLELRGDNPAASTDSRDFGLVEVASVRHLVVRRYRAADPS